MKKMKEMNVKTASSHGKGNTGVSVKKEGLYAAAGNMGTEPEEKENREYKDSVFVDLFYEDETAEKNLLSLYNALHGTDYVDEKAIRKIRVGRVLYKNFKNDISFEMNGTVLVFGEHQSTVNPNMPLHCLMYVGRAYERLIDKKFRYRAQQVKIPAPEFYVFYNGTEPFPLEKELYLSDAFVSPAEGCNVELKVTVININASMKHKILEKCSVLREYSLFIETVRKYSGQKNPLKRAIGECIGKGILADYLKRKGSEVANMLIAEYSYEEDMAVKWQEAFQMGKQSGERRGQRRGERLGKKKGILLSGKIFQEIKRKPELTDSQISKNIGCTVEDVNRVRKMFGI